MATSVKLLRSAVFLALVVGMALNASLSLAQNSSLLALTQERERLTAEYEQYSESLKILGGDDQDPTLSSNPAVRKLAAEMVRVKSQIIVVLEKELILLQSQISEAKEVASEIGPLTEKDIGNTPEQTTPDYSGASEEENVARLLGLLAQHYAELEESTRTMPNSEELALRKAAQRDAAALAHIPFSADKVRLSGAEGSTALANISERLSDKNIPESRHNIAKICSIKTHLYGTLISSENRSLKPIGKNNYIAKIRLQAGDTTIEIGGTRWEIQLPENLSPTNFLFTLYLPHSGKPELHIFSIADLLAQDKPYIPAWMPAEFKLPAPTG